jgi:hypothetical protein
MFRFNIPSPLSANSGDRVRLIADHRREARFNLNVLLLAANQFPNQASGSTNISMDCKEKTILPEG